MRRAAQDHLLRAVERDQFDGGAEHLPQGIEVHDALAAGVGDRAVAVPIHVGSAIVLPGVVEGAVAVVGRVGNDRERERAVGQIHLVQGVDAMRSGRLAVVNVVRVGHHVQVTGVGVDGRRAGNAVLGRDVAAADFGSRNRAHGHLAGPAADRHAAGAYAKERVLPKHLAVAAVDGIQAVVLGGHVDDVVRALVGTRCDIHARHVQRLGIHVAVNRRGELLAETGGIDVGGRQHGLRRIEPRVGGIVTIERDVGRQQPPRFQTFECRARRCKWRLEEPFDGARRRLRNKLMTTVRTGPPRWIRGRTTQPPILAEFKILVKYVSRNCR